MADGFGDIIGGAGPAARRASRDQR